MTKALLLGLMLTACSREPRATPTPATGADAATHRGAQGDQTMTRDPEPPGGTGVDEHGVLLRTRPDPDAPPPDPALLADDDANLLFRAGALVGDPAVQRRVWRQLDLVDAAGAPTPKMAAFIRAHQQWVVDRADRAQSVVTQAAASAYLDAHLAK